ncbi:MAG: hypothetical protein B6244_01290 [Candidatus Cloacimonetes bacterium 4572_55]|nr:MAG: hypothetical protein B6244_01290 [Candidatus Cloacimonetes bacterium 4572_55]
MYREIIINSTKNETRIAILEDGQFVELMTERATNQRMVGNIYKGVVSAVKPGIQAAFVDIGLKKSGFLSATEIGNLYRDPDDKGGSPQQHPPPKTGNQRIPIQKALRKGQNVLVQVLKEPIGAKGARLTADLSLAGRFVVLMPGSNHIAISRKISDRGERRRLKNLAKRMKPDNVGLIIRTVSKKISSEDLESDIASLLELWNSIKKKMNKYKKVPVRLHKEMSVTSGVIRDLFGEKIDSLVVDSKEDYRQILNYVKSVSPLLVNRIHLYREKVAIFDAFEIEKEIRKILERKAWLKSGGYIVIDHTEALIAIDVNTGRYTGKKNLEQTIFKTNMEATREIARQLRLRDIGGIIVVDFIDMNSRENRESVLSEFKNALKRDRSKTKVHEVSRLGLVEMTRQRTRPSIRHTYYDACPTCQGTGQILSKESLSIQIERWVKRAGISSRERRIRILANPTIARFILDENEQQLNELQSNYQIEIHIDSDASLGLDEFQVYSLTTNEEITEEFFA